MLAPQRHQPFMREAERLAQRSQVLFHQTPVEAVVAGGHRSVRRKRDLPSYAPRCRVKIDAFVLHAAADGFQHGEAAVAFVHVQHARRNPQGPQRTIAADAQQQFLPYAHAPIATV
jgi:hypothetical protein